MLGYLTEGGREGGRKGGREEGREGEEGGRGHTKEGACIVRLTRTFCFSPISAFMQSCFLHNVLDRGVMSHALKGSGREGGRSYSLVLIFGIFAFTVTPSARSRAREVLSHAFLKGLA